jgi:hypothetical protein
MRRYRHGTTTLVAALNALGNTVIGRNMISCHLIEATTCTPGVGWKKGQVENQVGVVSNSLRHDHRSRRLRTSMPGSLITYAKKQAHPEQTYKTVARWGTGLELP